MTAATDLIDHHIARIAQRDNHPTAELLDMLLDIRNSIDYPVQGPTGADMNRDHLYHGIFTTALEGGINYWCDVLNYHWSFGTPDYIEDLDGFGADILPYENGSDEILVIDRNVIARGYNLAAKTNGVHWSIERPPLFITEDTDWDYDAGDADCIVQLGLFGEVVYG